jgi:hypothetical protein
LNVGEVIKLRSNETVETLKILNFKTNRKWN